MAEFYNQFDWVLVAYEPDRVHLKCIRCGGHSQVYLPMEAEMIERLTRRFQNQHSACSRQEESRV